MKIALTGAASTGKTTLREALISNGNIDQHINIDARSLLVEMGEQNVGDMSPDKYRLFQINYIKKKLEEKKLTTVISLIGHLWIVFVIGLYIANKEPLKNKMNGLNLFALKVHTLMMYIFLHHLVYYHLKTIAFATKISVSKKRFQSI